MGVSSTIYLCFYLVMALYVYCSESYEPAKELEPSQPAQRSADELARILKTLNNESMDAKSPLVSHMREKSIPKALRNKSSKQREELETYKKRDVQMDVNIQVLDTQSKASSEAGANEPPTDINKKFL